jgi:pimeloyl-ACP methyl ester carboxylesterase
MVGYVSEFADQFRVVAVDPLGHGQSDKPHDPDAYDAAGVTADLVAVLDSAGIQQALIWGYSRGGWIAYGLAASHPDRVAGIVIGGFAVHAAEAEVASQSAWFDHLSRADWGGFWRTLGVEDPAPLRALEEQNDPLAIAAAVAGSQRPTRYVDLHAIHCRSLHYVGSEDWIEGHVRADAGTLAAPFRLLPNATHLSAFMHAEPAIKALRPELVAIAV